MQLKTTLAFALVATLFAACNGSDDNNPSGGSGSCSDCRGIEAKPAFDASNGGVYKGIIAGKGSGRFRLYAKNGDEKLYMLARYKRDNNPEIIDTLKPVNLANWTPDQNLMNVTFLGTQMRTEVYIALNGTSLSIGDFRISGPSGTGGNPQAEIMKELSTEEVKVYQGASTAAITAYSPGIFNAMLRGNKFIGLTDGNLRERISQDLDAEKRFSKLLDSFMNDVTISGQVNGDKITGTIKDTTQTLANMEANRSM